MRTRVLLTVVSFFLLTSFASGNLILIDAGLAGTGGSQLTGTVGGVTFNDFTGPTAAPNNIADLFDSTGALTGVGITYSESAPDAGVAGAGAISDNPGVVFPTTGPLAGVPVTALEDGLFIGAADVTLTLTGLDPTSTYDFLFFGSRGNNGTTQNFNVTDLNGTTSALHPNVFDNATGFVTFSGQVPDANNQIVIFLPNNGTGNGALNFIGIDEIPASTIPEPSSIFLFGLGGMLLSTIRRR